MLPASPVYRHFLQRGNEVVYGDARRLVVPLSLKTNRPLTRIPLGVPHATTEDDNYE